MPVNIKVRGGVQNIKQKVKNEKILSSNFLLTINTNQRYGDDDEDLENDIEVFDETIKEILNNIPQYVNLPKIHLLTKNILKMLILIIQLRKEQRIINCIFILC